jgi:predicted esterase
MKKTILLFTLLFPAGLISLYSQSIVGRQNVDQYPMNLANQLTFGLTWLPTDYNSTSERYPLIIFLHGSGECGDGINGLNRLIVTGLPQKIAQGWNPEARNPVDGRNYKFIVVSPQAPAASQWSYSYTHVRYILADVIRRYRIDESRIYITGLSAGGGGTWSSVTNDGTFTQRIAAIAPVSSMGANNPAVEAPNIQWIGGRYGVKVWSICGELDGHYSHNLTDINTINNATPAPTVPAVQTLIPGAGHEPKAWNTAYEDTWRDNPFNLNLFEWFLQYSRSGITPPANMAPIARAGNDASATLPTNSVSLDGRSSSDPDGTITSYTWVKTTGPGTFNIASSTSAATAVTGLIAGTYSFELTVTDDKGATAKDVVSITVYPPNQAPVARAGNDTAITLPASTANLDGRGSSDPDGTIASFSWVKTAGPAAFNITNATAANTTVTGLVEGTYSFELTVTDNRGATAKDVKNVTVNPQNNPNPPVNQLPSARAGNDIMITLPLNSVSLDGSTSADPDGTITNYNWVKTAGPASYNITNSTAAATTVTGLVEGTYSFELTVTDDKGATAKDVVTVTVNPKPNVAPVARAGNDTTVTIPGNTFSLDGSGSYDPDGTIVSYQWTKISGPSPFTMSNPTYIRPTLQSLLAGVYELELTVTDDKGAIAKDRVLVTILGGDADNKAPIARAGDDQTIMLPKTNTILDGTGSTDAEGMIQSFSWQQVSGPSNTTIAHPNAAETNVSGFTEGTYAFELTVTDDKGISGTDRVVIVIAKDSSQTGDSVCIYPVPVRSILTIKITGDEVGKSSISIYSTLGHLAYRKEFMKSTTEQLEKIDMSAMQAGAYVVVVQITDARRIKKVILKQ